MLEWLSFRSSSSQPTTQNEPESSVSDVKPKCKACCACPETKRVRDECVIEKGEAECQDLIEAHKQCMRSLGFKI